MSSVGSEHPDDQPTGSPDDPFARISAALRAVDEVDLAALSAAERDRFVRDLERVARQVGAVQSGVLDSVDRDGLYAEDAYWSARTMVRHLGQLSNVEAMHRDRVARALRDLPVTSDSYRRGDIGDCQVRRLARTWANPRVRELLVGAEAHLVDIARTESYQWFADAVTQWERLADQDGTIEKDSIEETADLRRRDDDGTWDLSSRLRSGDGALLREIFDHFVDAELAADWAAARAERGDDATMADLPRTDAQRRADALKAIFLDGASAPPGSKTPRLTINLLIDHEEYLRQCAILAGEEPPERFGVERVLRSRTANGTWVDPWDLASWTIGADLRRLVVGADSTIIDKGRRSRCYTGSARDAVMLRHPECVWSGCETSVRRCQADHRRPHAEGGVTDAENGQPLCGRHNRHKHRERYEVWCDPGGRWHTVRPDGTEL